MVMLVTEERCSTAGDSAVAVAFVAMATVVVSSALRAAATAVVAVSATTALLPSHPCHLEQGRAPTACYTESTGSITW
jgi:hypothetical protein